MHLIFSSNTETETIFFPSMSVLYLLFRDFQLYHCHFVILYFCFYVCFIIDLFSLGEGFDHGYFNLLASVLHPRHILTR